MAVAKAAPCIPKFIIFIKRMSKPMFTKAGIIMANMANFAFPSALIILFPIIQSAKKGTEKIMGKKNAVAGAIIAPFAPNSNSISLLKKTPSTTKREDSRKVIKI